MRTFVFLFCTTVFSFNSLDVISQNSKIVIESDKTLTVDQVFDIIDQQTNYSFVYKSDMFKNAPKVELKKGVFKTNKLLKKILNKGDYNVTVDENNTILIKKDIVIIPEKQQFKVSGIVLDASGQPLPGANVLEKGTSNGAQTDFDGNFSLEVANGNATLVISYIGFNTKEIPVNQQTQIKVTLEEDASKLNEVVVVGYGTQSRRKVTAAIVTVDTEDLQKITSANTASLLQGRAAGVSVENSGGAPGTGVSVVIRGTGTLSLTDQPLYVVDGNFVGDISFINPDDIKSMQVLKDAAAAAIYGNRAANGVVIVTTKRGRAGQVTFTFNSKLGIQSTTDRLDLLNGEEWVAARNQSISNSGGTDQLTWNGINTDWQDVQLSNALFQDYTVSASGGGENSTYFFSGQYLNQDGIVNSSSYERYSLRANSSFKKGRFKLEQSFLLTRELQDVNTFFFREFGPLPVQEVFDENNEGGFADAPALYNTGRPVNWYGISELEDDKSTVDRALINLSPSFEIIDGLTYKYNLGITYSLNHFRNFSPTYFVSSNPGGAVDISRLSEQYTRTVDILSEHTLNYTKQLGDHDFTLLAGYTTQKVESRGAGGVATDFPSNDLRTLSAGNVDTDVFGGLGESALSSILGRVNYSYKDKYLLSGSLRRDKTSRFIRDERTGTFPSFSAGWRVSSEKFFPQDGAISEFKIRGSWGQLGNQNVPNYVIQSTINNQNGYALGGTARVGATVLNLANPGLFWETTTSSNIGFDLQLDGGKWSFVADYYTKKSEDILVALPIPVGGGQGGSLTTNAADVENSGFEFLASYSNTWDNGLRFDASLNLTTLKNEVTGLGEGVQPIAAGRYNQGGLLATRTDVGQPIGSFYGHVVEGIYQDAAEIAADGRTGEADLGDLNFRDLDGDGDIDSDDRDFLGDAIPDFQFGLNLAASYKNFDLSMFITSVHGVDLWNVRWNDNLFAVNEGGDYLSIANNAWTPSNTNTNIPRLLDVEASGNDRPSSFFVEDGSYTRLKNIELGYTVPTNIFPENTLTNLRLYISAQNILTLTDYTGYDPEVGRSFAGGAVGTGVSSQFERGIDRAYPNAKSVFFGLQASF